MKTKMNNKKTALYGIMIAVLVCSVAAITWAFFELIVSGNSNPVVVESPNLGVKYTDTANVSMINAYTGDSIIKTFKVENTGEDTAYYDIKFDSVTNTFVDKTDLVYTLTSTNGGATISQTVVPSTTSTIANKISIPVATTQEYTLTITFLQKGTNQNSNMEKEFQSTIVIVENSGL